jgi:hypothetical protein
MGAADRPNNCQQTLNKMGRLPLYGVRERRDGAEIRDEEMKK